MGKSGKRSKHRSDLQVYFRLLGYLKGYRWMVVMLMCFIVMEALFTVATISMVKPIKDLLENKNLVEELREDSEVMPSAELGWLGRPSKEMLGASIYLRAQTDRTPEEKWRLLTEELNVKKAKKPKSEKIAWLRNQLTKQVKPYLVKLQERVSTSKEEKWRVLLILVGVMVSAGMMTAFARKSRAPSRKRWNWEINLKITPVLRTFP